MPLIPLSPLNKEKPVVDCVSSSGGSAVVRKRFLLCTEDKLFSFLYLLSVNNNNNNNKRSSPDVSHQIKSCSRRHGNAELGYSLKRTHTKHEKNGRTGM